MELIFSGIKSKKAEDYIHRCNETPFREGKNRYKFITTIIAENTENFYLVTLNSEKYFDKTRPNSLNKTKFAKQDTGNLVKNLYSLILK